MCDAIFGFGVVWGSWGLSFYGLYFFDFEKQEYICVYLKFRLEDKQNWVNIVIDICKLVWWWTKGNLKRKVNKEVHIMLKSFFASSDLVMFLKKSKPFKHVANYDWQSSTEDTVMISKYASHTLSSSTNQKSSIRSKSKWPK